MQNKILELLNNLLKCPSITPNDEGCQDIIESYLKNIGFEIKRFQEGPVSNMMAYKGPIKNIKPLVFIGHTDVVAPGEIQSWNSPPFSPTIVDNNIIGRGAADMKGNLAAYLIALEEYLTNNPEPNFSPLILLTSAEEGDHCGDGIPKLLDKLPCNNIDYCIVGEPTSSNNIGDTIKTGRRGSLTCKLTIQGKSGHVGYPDNIENPIYTLKNYIEFLKNIFISQEKKSASSLQITNISTNNTSGNVTPEFVYIDFNIRYDEAYTKDELIKLVHDECYRYNKNISFEWTHFGKPYKSRENTLFHIASQAIKDITNIDTISSNNGGTSDGRYIAHLCNNIIEFGGINKTIHKPNERISIDDLIEISQIYFRIMELIDGRGT